MNGNLVKLEAIKVGSRMLTSEPAVERFLASLNAVDGPEAIPRTQVQKKRAVQKAVSDLEAAGC
jgi:hypothetical protein